MVSDTPPTHTGDRAKARTLTITTERPRIDEVGEVIYHQVKRIDAVRGLRMTLLVPRTSDPKPAILYVPGGGFTSAAHRKFIEIRLALAQAGFVVAAAEYRVVPDIFPASLEDGKAAIRYLRSHADEYGVDPDRIGVLGDSAGGWLAQMLAMTGDTSDYDRGDWLDTSAAVQAAVSLYGISDLRNIGAGFSETVGQVHASTASTEALLVHGVAFGDFAGATIGSDPVKALAASPVGHMSGAKPPLMLMHGSADDLVSPVQSEQMATALREREAEADYVVVDGAGHGDGPWFQPALIDYIVAWFGEKLVKG
jgi:acetyl esterase/lipase